MPPVYLSQAWPSIVYSGDERIVVRAGATSLQVFACDRLHERGPALVSADIAGITRVSISPGPAPYCIAAFVGETKVRVSSGPCVDFCPTRDATADAAVAAPAGSPRVHLSVHIPRLRGACGQKDLLQCVNGQWRTHHAHHLALVLTVVLGRLHVCGGFRLSSTGPPTAPPSCSLP
jgi:hypothetical protein